MNKNILIKKAFKIVSIIFIVFLFGGYILPKESIRPPKNVPDEIFELNQEILNIIDSNDSSSIRDDNYWINDLYKNKNSLNSIEKLMLKTSNKFEIRRIFINKEYRNITYYFGSTFNFAFIRDIIWSYEYSPDEMIENKVNSVEEAIEEINKFEDRYIFKYSETTDRKYWFRCACRD